ncbi:MAG: histidinol dehydrogenase [Candidatus Omnitrophica bacterium]|nr:histidinol dehydrogenase [Candidatus Omnitrophota bacterium]MCM8809367.1 histidinol dehydrogenase [Candidatus Omnitrophota bacterium]MCM8832628.1 histidinol dehydrogenase [Candidatus Omnitrophota bacterium]
MKKIDFEQLKKIIEQRKEEDIEENVREIIEKVKKDKDRAILYFTKKFDKVDLKKIKVSKEEIKKSREELQDELFHSIKKAAERIENYHKKQLPKGFKIREKDVEIEFNFIPIEKVGIYIPAGQAPLISTILMTVIPAKIAKVKEIYICSPPSYNGKVHPLIIAVSSWLGVKEIFQVGGVQAISGFAFGTETIPKVDLVVGPGNKYVNTAKRLLFGEVGIDLLAGPSELVIFSDSSGKVDFIEYDLKAQIEHTDGLGILITTDEKLASLLSEKVENGYCIVVKDEKEAIEIINYICPEHLQVFSKRPYLFKKCKAGAIFIGDYTPATIGDYFAGPSHVLPTGQAARFSSGLSVYNFLRSYSIIKSKKEFIKKNGKYIEKLTKIEGLKQHKNSIKIREKYN